MTAISLPSAVQSAESTSNAISRGAPPETGTEAKVPWQSPINTSLQPIEIATSEEETANNVESLRFSGRDSGLPGTVEKS
jgi:hypothetical protein